VTDIAAKGHPDRAVFTGAEAGEWRHYVRVSQRGPENPDGDAEMAWASPFFVTYRPSLQGGPVLCQAGRSCRSRPELRRASDLPGSPEPPSSAGAACMQHGALLSEQLYHPGG
jgi:hypothetical protein